MQTMMMVIKKKKKKKVKPQPLVCKVLSVEPVPKKDRLRLCTVNVGELGDVELITNAPNVAEGLLLVVALPGVTTADGIEVKDCKIAGIESVGMLCGPEQLGWESSYLDEKLAVVCPDDAVPGEPIPSEEEVVAALKAKEAAEAAAQAAKSKDKKGKEKKGKAEKDDDEDLDALLAEAGLEAAPKAEAGKKKKKGKAAADEEDLDALLEEAGLETAPPPAAKGKAKGKAKAAAAAAADDDAALEEAAQAFSPPPRASDEEVKANAAAVKAALEAPVEEEEEDAKTIANRKKKEKKKAAQKAAVGGEGMWGSDEAAKPAEAPTDAPAPKTKAQAKPKGKESAIVRAARERLEEEQRLAEEKRIFEEKQRKEIEEAERLEREEEEREAAIRAAKREKREAKIAQQKADGTYQTKTEKERAKRAALLREQFGFVMEDDADGGNAGEAAAAPPAAKKVLATKQKKKPQQAAKVDVDEKKDEPSKPEAKPAPAKLHSTKAAEEVKAEEDEDDDDDWEKIVEAKVEKKADKTTKRTQTSKQGEDHDDEEAEDEEEEEEEEDSDSEDDFLGYRAPIVCIMGHVDTGKTKLLDKIRRTNVQDNEAGGITQQIGATYFPDIALHEQTKKVDPDFDIEVPGIMIIDTPGHESFNNLRMRGSSLCDIAILVVDCNHGLEPQTLESLEMLKQRRCPFIVALNKIDVCYQWQSKDYICVRDSLATQQSFVVEEFNRKKEACMLQLKERGLNCELYWENEDYKTNFSVVPTSALTGEGVPDLLYMLLNLTQTLMSDKLERKEELQCSVIEVKNIEGLGTTIDVILVNGTLNEGDDIIVAGMNGAIRTTIRALVTPQPMKEMRVKNEWVHHKKIDTSMGVKICAPGLDEAVAGTELFVVGEDDDVEELMDDAQGSFDSILTDFEKQPEGVYVKASTLGSLEALLQFLKDMKIPVFDVGIGEVHKKDVKKALIQKEKSHPEYAVILCFDVKVNNEAKLHADKEGLKIFTADIIYHLFDHFTNYKKEIDAKRKTETREEAVFPCILEIDKQYIFHKKDPIVCGMKVVEGILKPGTPICIPDKEFLEIGRVGGIEKDKKAVQQAKKGESVCVKIEQNTAQTHIAIGRHFDHTNKLYSKISRQSIDTLKANFKDEMKKEDWALIIAMKKIFNIE